MITVFLAKFQTVSTSYISLHLTQIQSTGASRFKKPQNVFLSPNWTRGAHISCTVMDVRVANVMADHDDLLIQ